MKTWFIIIVFLIGWAGSAHAQACTTLGQTPGTAFPVCGTSTFSQTTVPICGISSVPTPGCGAYVDVNPFWYRFTCFKTGTLGFVITPKNISDDYDWQVFDITGHSPEEVYTNSALYVTSNWSGESGKTGASGSGTSTTVCGGYGQPLWSKMPTITEGHEYLLLVSHFTSSQSGYSLSFNGGTASITDTVTPHVASAYATCDGTQIMVTLNKGMKCSSLSANGSEFTLSPSITIASASAPSCSSGFDMDTIILTLQQPLTPGTYTLGVKNGGDGNTLLDNCDNGIAVGEATSFTLNPSSATPLDSITPLDCRASELELFFSTPMQCSSIASDGSDFLVTGPASVTVTRATGDCSNGLTNHITLTLLKPIMDGGTYQVTLQTGSDGNTILNQCDVPTPAGDYLRFTGYDTVSAYFDMQIRYGCLQDTIDCSHNGGNDVNSWLWTVDGTEEYTTQNMQKIYTDFGNKTIKLEVSNGVCTSSHQVAISLSNGVKAAFEAPDMLCPEESAVFIDLSTGPIIFREWDFGNGNFSSDSLPPAQNYPIPDRETVYPIRLIVGSDAGCQDTLIKDLLVLKSCYIAVPSAFTPNNDNVNDYLYPLNAYKATNLSFKVYNRYGQLVFETTDWTKKWDGKINGHPQAAGVYVWTLSYTHIETGQQFNLKGTTLLIR